MRWIEHFESLKPICFFSFGPSTDFIGAHDMLICITLEDLMCVVFVLFTQQVGNDVMARSNKPRLGIERIFVRGHDGSFRIEIHAKFWVLSFC
jgi:hypothetical protein